MASVTEMSYARSPSQVDALSELRESLVDGGASNFEVIIQSSKARIINFFPINSIGHQLVRSFDFYIVKII